MASDELVSGRGPEIWRLPDGRHRLLVAGCRLELLVFAALVSTLRPIGRWTIAVHARVVLLACDISRWTDWYKIYVGSNQWVILNGVFLYFSTGCGCLLAGVVISVVDWMYPNRFSTVIEVDYDTPYDRHVIIEESHDTRFKKRGSKDEQSLGSRILR